MDTAFSIFLVIAVLIVLALLVGYIIYRERSHLIEVMQLLGHLDTDGKVIVAKAATWIEGLPAKFEPDHPAIPAYPFGTLIVLPDDPNYAAAKAASVGPLAFAA